ncbi:MAG: hypothetical protein WAU60_08120 [Candidatus Competibacter denitrificans]|jgi:conjugative transfer region protein (TIGR03748 family)
MIHRFSCGVVSLLISSISYAVSPVYSGYAVITEAPLATDLDQSVYKTIQGRTVLEGLLEVLNGSGYQLAAQAAADPEIDRLYRQPYPENQRTVGPRALKEVLERLAGPAWLLVIDPLNRLVSFEVRRSFQPGVSQERAAALDAQPPVAVVPRGGQ